MPPSPRCTATVGGTQVPSLTYLHDGRYARRYETKVLPAHEHFGGGHQNRQLLQSGRAPQLVLAPAEMEAGGLGGKGGSEKNRMGVGDRGEQGRAGTAFCASSTIPYAYSTPLVSPEKVVIMQPDKRLPPRLRQFLEGRCGGQGEPGRVVGGRGWHELCFWLQSRKHLSRGCAHNSKLPPHLLLALIFNSSS